MADIRPYEEWHWPGVWTLLEPVFRAGETYGVAIDISEDAARRKWTASPTKAYVVLGEDGSSLLGTYYLGPNAGGPGAHVCNCGYIVSPDASGRGLATAMCTHSQSEAVRQGFRAMQFNLVAASNEGAVHLWTKLGFATVGRLPGAFAHPTQGFVDAYVMYKSLGPS